MCAFDPSCCEIAPCLVPWSLQVGQMQVSLASAAEEDMEMPADMYVSRTVSLNRDLAASAAPQQGKAAPNLHSLMAIACAAVPGHMLVGQLLPLMYLTTHYSKCWCTVWVPADLSFCCRSTQNSCLLLVLGRWQSGGMQSLPTMLLLQLLQAAPQLWHH